LTSWRAGAIMLAAGMLVAACSGGSGGPGPVDSNLLPTGIAGGTSGAHGSKSASGSGKASGSHTASRGASTSGGSSSTSSHHGGGGHTSTTAGHPSTSSKPVDNGCRSSAPPKPSDVSKASITVCPAIGLSGGDSVTITGHSFKPNESLIATQCHYLGENANNYALSQCNIGNILNFKPARTTKSDASGNVGPVTLVVQEKFKKIDCSAVQCLISVAVPIQNGAADNPHVLISFG
jgi:hypothetical protein